MFQIKQRSAFTGLLMLAATAGFSQKASSQPIQEIIEPRVPAKAVTIPDVSLERGSRLIGLEVRSPEGKVLGTIKDIALNSRHDRISYVGVERNEFLGVRARIVGIPWSQFKIPGAAGDTGRYLTMNVTENTLEKMEGFTDESWPKLVGSNWLKEQMPEKGASREAEPKMSEVCRLSKLMNAEVSFARHAAFEPSDEEKESSLETLLRGLQRTGDKVGRLKEAVINAETGQVAYGFIELDEPEAHKGEMTTVPWSAMKFYPGPQVHATLHASSAEPLATFAFVPSQEAEKLAILAQHSEARRVFMAYDQGPQWEALGFVAPAEPKIEGNEAPTPDQINPPDNLQK